MRFGSSWKLIDLEGCLSTSGDTHVCPENITPLYASPELAQFTLEGATDAMLPCGTMDTWAAGVALLDILANGSAFQDTKSGFDMAALFEEEAIPFESWYRWLADPEPICLEDYVAAHSPNGKLLRSSAE